MTDARPAVDARRGSSASPTSSRSRARRWTRPRSTTSPAAPGTRSRSPTTSPPGGVAGSGRASSSTSSAVDPSTTMLGSPVAMPVAIAPMAAQALAHPDAELAMARAAAAAGFPFIALDDVVALDRGRRRGRAGRRRAGSSSTSSATCAVSARSSSGRRRPAIGAIILTVDLPVLGYRERDRRSGFELPAARQLRRATGRPIGRSDRPATGRPRRTETTLETRTLTWADLARDPELVVAAARPQGDPDRRGRPARGRARRRRDRRQQPRRPPARPRPGDRRRPRRRSSTRSAARTEVWVDGGVRRGLDIVIALALGARGVLLGRPMLLGAGRRRPGRRRACASRSCARSSRSRWPSSGTPTPADITRAHLV